MQARFGRWIPILALSCVVLLPALAAAQGQIVGQVKDESGGILPGVTVEASSPALIEKTRSVVTDDQGRYRIVDLRPGIYKLTFTLTGFSTQTRDNIAYAADQLLNINIDMKVGSLEESVTVSGQTPQVDVQQATRVTAITRDIIDTLPVSRNIMSIGVLAPGVRQGAPDIGGSNMTEQVALRAHGLAGLDGEQLVEGMSIQSYEGASQSYFDDMLQSEISVMTAAIPADTTGGGIRLNSILKDGGNQISGAVFIGGSSGSWQANNIDAALRARGIQSANGVGHVQQFTGSMGGPLVKDKLWWIVAARHQSSDQTIANVPQNFIATDGTFLRGLSDNYVRGPSVRLTWQATQKNKIAMFFQRWWKRKGKDFTAGQDPRSATQRNPVHAHHYVGDAKYTSPITNKMLLEAGFSTAEFSWLGSGQPGTTGFTPFSPQWYAMARRTDSALNINPLCAYPTGCTAWVYNGLDERRENTRKTLSTALSYVTGSHNLKFGVQHEFGPDTRKGYENADLVENYVNGKPSTVSVSNTPYNAPGHVDFDNAVYAMDSWTLKRLTINPGVRVHWFKASALQTSMPAGRFAPARFYPAKTLIDWGPDTTPRLSAAYDLFGNGKVALKASASKYYRRYNADAFQIYADAGHVTENRNWFDCDLNALGTACSGLVLPTNGDGIAQDNEIGPGTATFGQKALRTADPGLQRQYNWEYTVGVQDQVAPRLAVGWMMYKRRIGNIQLSDRTQIRPSDYSSFTLPMPDFSNDPTLAGVLNPSEVLTVYNLNPAKRTVFGAPIVDTAAPNDQSLYTGFETNFSLRIPGTTLFGSWTSEHNISVFCDTLNDPNGTSTGDLYSGATVSAGGRFCDQRLFHLPFRNEYKLAGNYPIPVVHVDFGFVIQSFPGADRVVSWSPAQGLFPGGQRTNTETIVLSKPGTLFQPRWNQLDVNFKKPFRYGKNVLTLEIEYFNVLNANAVWTTNNSIGGSLGQVTSILPGRIPRLALQYKW